MPTAPDDADRLLELERILASSSSAPAPASLGSDITEMMLGSVLTERIRKTTSLLSQPRTGDVDAADLVAMRLLLADYTAAVSHLRAATSATEARLARVAAGLKNDVRRVTHAVDEAARRERATAARPEGSG
jgi:hypothetical protein